MANNASGARVAAQATGGAARMLGQNGLDQAGPWPPRPPATGPTVLLQKLRAMGGDPTFLS